MLKRLFLSALAAVPALSTAACDPYACGTEARSATYTGLLGQDVAPSSTPSETDPGRIFLQLNEWRGSVSQQGVIAAANVRGFVAGVSTVHVHEGSPTNPGRILWESANGYPVGDSIWRTGMNLFEGPGSWNELWVNLEADRGYFELHAAGGDSVSGAVRQTASTPFSPSCT